MACLFPFFRGVEFLWEARNANAGQTQTNTLLQLQKEVF